ncbi:MAG: protein kinase [Planctomycetota bacterium]
MTPETAYEQFLSRSRGGESVDFEEFCGEFPQFATALRILHLAQDEEEDDALGASGHETKPVFDGFLRSALATSDQYVETGSARYRRDVEVGRGGMGVVWKAWDRQLERFVAMKVLRSSNDSTETPRHDSRLMNARFVNEARITGRLDHPGIVSVHEVGFDESQQPFFTMTFIEGVSLTSILQRVRDGVDAWSVSRAVGVFVKMCDALAYAHSHGVVHRDLKPENVMVGRFGEVFVMDWGLAKARDLDDLDELIRGGEDSDRRPPSSSSFSFVTFDGSVMGTPAFMPPEQARGEMSSVGERSDVYAVGAMLYMLLAGKAPYSKRRDPPSTRATLDAVRAGELERLSDVAPSRAPELVAICEKAMDRDPGQRYESVESLRAELQAFLDGRVVRAHRTGAAVELVKWYGRNRAFALSTTAALLLLVAGLLAVVFVQKRANVDLGRERDAKDEALVLKDEALGKEKRALDKERAAVTVKNHALKREKGREQISRSQAVLAEDPALALKLAIEGADAAPGFLANNALLEALSRVREEHFLFGWGHHVRRAQFHPTSSLILSASRDGRLRLWDGEAGELEALRTGHGVQANDCAFSPDGELFASCGWDNSVQVWKLDEPERLYLFKEASNVVNRVFFSPDSRRLASVADDGLARVYDLELGRLSFDGSRHRATVTCAEFHPKRDLLLTTSRDRRAIVWDLNAKKALRVFSGHQDSVTWGAFDGRGERVATASADGTARVWSMNGEGEYVDLRGHVGSVTEVRFTPSDSHVVTASVDGNLRLWEATTGRCVAILRGHVDEVTSFDFGAAGRLVASGSMDRTGLVWDLSFLAAESEPKDATIELQPNELQPIARLSGHTERVLSIDFSSNSRRIVTASFDGSVRTWDVSDLLDAVERPKFPRAGKTVFDPTGTRVLRYGLNRKATIADRANGEVLHTLAAHREIIADATFSPDGRRAATASRDRSAIVWDVKTGGLVARLYGHRGEIDCVAFSHDSRKIATGCRYWKVKIWDAETGRELLELGSSGWILDVEFLPGDKEIVSINDHWISVWNLETRKPRNLRNRGGEFYRCDVEPQGRFVLAATIDNDIAILDTATKKRYSTLVGQDAEMLDAVWSPDASTVATCDREGIVRVWRLKPEERVFAVTADAGRRVSMQFDESAENLTVTRIDGSTRTYSLDPLRVATAARRSRPVQPRDFERDPRRQLEETSRARRKFFENAINRDLDAYASRFDRASCDPESSRKKYLKAWRLAYVYWMQQEVTGEIEGQIDRLIAHGRQTTGGADRVVVAWDAYRACLKGRYSEAAAVAEAGELLVSPGSFRHLREQTTAMITSWQMLFPQLPSYASIDAYVDTFERNEVISLASEWKIRRSLNEPSTDSDWRLSEFDDSGWESAKAPFGYGATGQKLSTVLLDMKNRHVGVYARQQFVVDDVSGVSHLEVDLYVDDGCVVWINGTEAYRVRVSKGETRHDTRTPVYAPEPLPKVTYANIPASVLRRGKNIIAIHAMNHTLDSSDFVLSAGLRVMSFLEPEQRETLVESFRETVSDDAGRKRLAYFEGRCLEKRGEHEAALEKFRAASSKDPSQFLPQLRQAECLRTLGRPDEAKRILRGALEKHPEVAETCVSLLLDTVRQISADANAGREHRFRAVLFARRALALDPESAVAMTAVAAAEFQIGIGDDADAPSRLPKPPRSWQVDLRPRRARIADSK